MKQLVVAAAVGLVAMALAACQSMSAQPPLPPLALAPEVDLPRFMGDWYVIANIPTFLEKGAHNAKESYRLDADGSVATTFSFRADSFEGPERSFRSRGFILAPGNAVWGQQYVWPIKADYRISYVAGDYSQTVITREKRDYVWIMARTPTISDADYGRLVALVGAQGYDTGKLQRVPQQAAAAPP
jgi:apolipoprotein D and lipocalin family protein